MALIDNLVSYWKLDEASGNRSDAHGTLTLTDNNTVGSTTGKLNNAALFVPASSEFLSNSSAAPFGNAWTISGWLKRDADAVNRTFVTLRPSAGTADLVQIEGTTSSFPRILLYNSSGTNFKDYRGTVTAFALNDWTFITVTWDGTNLKLYMNGSDETSSATKTVDNSGSQSNSTRNLRIGAETASSNFWSGAIDEVGFWSRALSASEVSQLYNGGNGLAYPFPADVKLFQLLGVGK